MCVSACVFFSIDPLDKTKRHSKYVIQRLKKKEHPQKMARNFLVGIFGRSPEDPPFFWFPEKKKGSQPLDVLCVDELTTFFYCQIPAFPEPLHYGMLTENSGGELPNQAVFWCGNPHGRYRFSLVLHAYIHLKMDGKD